MFSKYMKYVVITIIFLCINHVKGQDWKFAEEKNDIKVYTRLSKDSPVKEFKAEVVFNADVNDIITAITNFKDYHKWADHVQLCSLITDINANEKIFYSLIEMPFPFDDRDMVNKMAIFKNNDYVKIEITSLDNLVPVKDNVVRMPISRGGWLLTPLTDTTTAVNHFFMGDPAGNIPSSVVNMFLVSGQINSLTNLQKELAK